MAYLKACFLSYKMRYHLLSKAAQEVTGKKRYMCVKNSKDCNLSLSLSDGKYSTVYIQRRDVQFRFMIQSCMSENLVYCKKE